MAGEVGLPKKAVANDLGLLKETNNMDNKKLKQLVKEALSNMVEEETETENEVEITVNINGEEQELDEINVDDFDKNFDTAISSNEGTTAPNKKNPATDIADDPNLGNDHFQNVEEMDMGGDVEDPDADDLADQIIMMSDTDLEEETHSLREFFDLDEMARKAQSYKLTDRLTNAGSFLQRVNDRIKAKTMGAGGRGRKAKEFTEEDIANMLDVLGQGTFTSQDVVSAIGRFDKVQPVNAILAKMRDKGYIDYAEDLKKSMEPDTSAEPKRRGRPPAPKPPSPEDEFDAPEMEPEMAPDDDPVVQQATQAQAQAQDPKRKAVKDFMDQMKAMGIISDTNKVLDMDTYKDEFAKFKSTMNENIYGSVGFIPNDKDAKPEHPNWRDLSAEEIQDYIDANPNTLWGRSLSIAKMVLRDKKRDEDDEPWTDPAGGTHYGDEDDPAAAYIEEDNTLNESKNKTMKKQLLQERFQQLAGIKPLYAINSLKEGTIEHEWDGLPEDTKLDIIGDAKSGRADYSDLEKDFATLKSEIPNFESGVANYLGIDEGGGEEKNEIFGFGKNKKSSGGSSDTYDVYGHAGGSAHSLGSGYESEQEAKNKSRSKRRQFQKNFKVDSPAFSITKNNKTVWSI